MENFEIIKRDGSKINLASKDPFRVVTSAVQNTELMGDDSVQLTIVSSDIISLEKGDKIQVFGGEYTIRTTTNREKLSDTHYVHEATFYGAMYELMKSQYRNTDANGRSTKSTFDLTYSIKDFLKVLIYNVERDYPGVWKFDEANCPDTEPKTIQFSKQNCLQVLQGLCSKDNFDMEFLISQKKGVRTIHIGRFGEKVVPPGGNEFFEWGKGMGLYRLKEQKVDDKSVITRLWIEGGNKNIRLGYRDYSDRLQIPFPKRLNKKEHTLSNGDVIQANSEYIGIDNDNNRYIEDPLLAQKIGSDEDSKTYNEIYPSRTGVVSSVGDDINSFFDESMNFDLLEKNEEGETKYLINGVTAKINFITGKLAGQQFELKKDGGYVHSERKFTIIPFTDERGLTIPTTETDAYRISDGDKYKITDINLPDSYVEDAEEDLWYAGYDDFLSATQARAQYQLLLDRKYLIDSLPGDSDATVFRVGDYVPVRDVRFGIEKNIRIQKVSRNLLLEHDYTLTLSDVTSVSIVGQTIIDVISHGQIIENNGLQDLNKAKKGWRTTEELRNMVYDTDGYFDVDNIRPNSIDTNMLTVGSKSQQFVLENVVFEPNFEGNGNIFKASAGVLSHLTIEESDIRKWNISSSEFNMKKNGGYYLFAKCKKNGKDGIWYLTQEQIKFYSEEEPNSYYFLVGVISSLYKDGFRDFVTTYGFTRINGNTITTGKVQSSDGECYIDLDGNRFRIGDSNSSVDWNVTDKHQLTLKNVRLLSQSGDVSAIGVYRGVYNSDWTYYLGDEVSYTHHLETCTYRYIHNTPSTGNPPTNQKFWNLIAKGAPGSPGNAVANVDIEYAISSSNSIAPLYGWQTTSPEWVDGKFIWSRTRTTYSDGTSTTTDPVCLTGATGNNGVGIKSITEEYYLSISNKFLFGGEWSTTYPGWKNGFYIWTRSVVVYTNGATTTTTAICVTGSKGEKGDSPALVFRGIYNDKATYYGNKNRVDAVELNGIYYVATVDSGTFSNQLPHAASSYWSNFGAQFDSVATNLLLAKEANVAGWIFRNNRLESQNGSAYLDGINGKMRLRGTLQLSTGYTGDYSDVNLFYLPVISVAKFITMGYEKDDIGKVVRLYNSSPFGGGTYYVNVLAFGIIESSEEGVITDTTIGVEYGMNLSVRIPPQTTVELTCFELPKEINGKTYDIVGRWNVTARFGVDQFTNMYAQGRFPRIIAMGTLIGNKTGVEVIGRLHNGAIISDIITASRKGEGHYVLTSKDPLPRGYKVFATGVGDTQMKPTVVEYEGSFVIYISDDDSRNDGSANFMIMDPYWWYDTSV